MPRKPRIILPEYPHHIILRGNNKNPIFYKDQDRHFFIQCLRESKKKTSSKIFSYCLMNNHAHFIIEPSSFKGLPNMIQSLGRRYVRYINDKYKRSGTLWEGRYKSNLIDKDKYFLCCSRYVELNPVRARIVKHPKDYPWSSFNAKANGKPNDLLDIDPIYKELGSSDKERQRKYREFVLSGISESEIQMIKLSIKKDSVIGSESFIDKVSNLLDRSIKPKKRGRPKKSL